MDFEYTVATPRVKGRGEAWLAWEASLLKLYVGGKNRPANNFWKQWKKLKLDLYNVVKFKEFTGSVELERLDGKIITVNLLEKPSRGRSGFDSFDLIHGFKIKDEYPELQKAQLYIRNSYRLIRASYGNLLLLAKFPILLEYEYVRFRLNPAEIARMVEMAEEAGREHGLTVWTASGPEHVGSVAPGCFDYEGFYLEGVLANSLQGLLNGLEYHGHLNPLGDTLDEK